MQGVGRAGGMRVASRSRRSHVSVRCFPSFPPFYLLTYRHLNLLHYFSLHMPVMGAHTNPIDSGSSFAFCTYDVRHTIFSRAVST